MLEFLSSLLLTLYQQLNNEYVPLITAQTCIKLVQKCTLTSVFGQSVFVFKHTKVVHN